MWYKLWKYLSDNTQFIRIKHIFILVLYFWNLIRWVLSRVISRNGHAMSEARTSTASVVSDWAPHNGEALVWQVVINVFEIRVWRKHLPIYAFIGSTTFQLKDQSSFIEDHPSHEMISFLADVQRLIVQEASAWSLRQGSEKLMIFEVALSTTLTSDTWRHFLLQMDGSFRYLLQSCQITRSRDLYRVVAGFIEIPDMRCPVTSSSCRIGPSFILWRRTISLTNSNSNESELLLPGIFTCCYSYK